MQNSSSAFSVSQSSKIKQSQQQQTGSSMEYQKHENQYQSTQMPVCNDLSASTIHLEQTVQKQDDTLREDLAIGHEIEQQNLKPYQHRINTSLAYAIVQRYPQKIKLQMEKVILYYEKTIYDQERAYKKLLKQKNLLKSLATNNEGLHEQQNWNKQQSLTQQKDNRLDDLEKKLIDKNQQINGLNQQITELLIKNKKYKKKIKETQKNMEKVNEHNLPYQLDQS